MYIPLLLIFIYSCRWGASFTKRVCFATLTTRPPRPLLPFHPLLPVIREDRVGEAVSRCRHVFATVSPKRTLLYIFQRMSERANMHVHLPAAETGGGGGGGGGGGWSPAITPAEGKVRCSRSSFNRCTNSRYDSVFQQRTTSRQHQGDGILTRHLGPYL